MKLELSADHADRRIGGARRKLLRHRRRIFRAHPKHYLGGTRLMAIENEEEYARALRELSDVMDAVPGTAEEHRLEQLVELIEAYEAEHWPFGHDRVDSTGSQPPTAGPPGNTVAPEDRLGESSETTVLTPADAARFLELLENPPEPNAALRSAAEAYRRLISSSE